MTHEEILDSLALEGGETTTEKAAKIITWFLDSNWHETWAVEDERDITQYIEMVVADLKDSK